MPKIETKNYLTRLGIKYEDLETKLLNLTDEEVEDSYIDKLVDIYVELKGAKENDEIKDDIYNLLAKGHSKVKIIILENKIDELSEMSGKERDKDILIGMYKMSYEALKTEEKRKQYAKTLQKQKPFNQDLLELIKKNGGHPDTELETKQFFKGNIPSKLAELNDKPDYSVEYEDGDIVLFHRGSFVFDNGQFMDKTNKYLICVKSLLGDHIGISYDFYGDVKIIEMKNPRI